ncbi:MAG: alpha/beta hydrolase, partial [Bacteroidota bacterium]|nr:alpha/beta hydrolase [Bacteroidota bacterium]
ADAVAWIAMFKADKKFSKIYVLGHSEGSLIGIIAAEQIPVDGLISIAGVGRTADKIILEQIKNQPKEFVDQTKSILDSLVSGKLVKNVSPQMQMLFRPSVQPYMISWLKYDPAKEIKNLLKPVLIVQGTNDIQVSVEDAKLLSAAKPDAKLLIIEKMNHIMKECDADLNKNYETYNKPDLPLKSGLVDGILDFVK